MIVSENNLEKARKLIRSSKELVVVLAQDIEFNRKLLESAEFSTLLFPEKTEQKTSLKKQNIGFDYVCAKLAKSKGVEIGFDMNELVGKEIKKKAELVGKLKNLIEVCKKEKMLIKFVSVKEKRDVSSLVKSLGGASWQAKQ